MKTALITGVTGQDGSYLSELLLKDELAPYAPSASTMYTIIQILNSNTII